MSELKIGDSVIWFRVHSHSNIQRTPAKIVAFIAHKVKIEVDTISGDKLIHYVLRSSITANVLPTAFPALPQ
jgi:hypothetical protein